MLPGIKIGNLKERAPYLRYWSQEDRELSALMPRQLEAHLEGDFEALREALKRRLGP